MFNERDRRCAAVQPMLSTDPSYDNRTIASTFKMQIWISTNNSDVPRVMKTKFPATVMVFGVVSSEGHIMPPHIFEVGLIVNTKCTWMCWRVWWSPGAIRRPVADSGVAVGLGAGPQVQRDPDLASEGVPRLVPFSHWPPPPPALPRWTTSFGHTSRTSPTWPPTTPKLAWSPPSGGYLPSSRGDCGKGMLLVPDPYRGGDWGWRQLDWIDVSSTT